MRALASWIICVSVTAAPLAAAAQSPSGAIEGGSAMSAPIVFFDIAGPDSAAQSRFYSEVFGWEIGADGRLNAPVHSANAPGTLSGLMRGDPAEKVLYIGVEDVTATLGAVEEQGGAVFAPRMEVPGVVVIGLFTDPAGNRMGLVEMADGKVIVP